jgi:hypothetical protein
MGLLVLSKVFGAMRRGDAPGAGMRRDSAIIARPAATGSAPVFGLHNHDYTNLGSTLTPAGSR